MVEHLEEFAFQECNNLEVLMLNKLKMVPKSAFENCVLLRNVQLPNCVQIDDFAFKNCKIRVFNAPLLQNNLNKNDF